MKKIVSALILSSLFFSNVVLAEIEAPWEFGLLINGYAKLHNKPEVIVYFKGIVKGITIASIQSKGANGICSPNQNLNQVANPQVVEKEVLRIWDRIKDNNEINNSPLEVITLTAMKKLFPCKK